MNFETPFGRTKRGRIYSGKMSAYDDASGVSVEKRTAIRKALERKKEGKKKSYTGHYQMDRGGSVRHQSPESVKRKGLDQY